MIFTDFEFNQTKEYYLNLVSCVTYIPGEDPIEWWLHKDPFRQEELREYFVKHKDKIIVGFADIAEARSLFSLHLNPMDFKWIDLHLEWRQLTNHNPYLSYGEHLIDGRKVKLSPAKPKWQRREGDKGSQKLKHSLAECTFKLTGEIRDTEEKDRLRDLIISCPEEFSETEKRDILAYNKMDVVHLETILERVEQEYKKVLKGKYKAKEIHESMLLRGRYAALTAIRESKGYPIDYAAVKNFTKAIDHILKEIQLEINSLFPGIQPFRWDRKKGKFSWNQLATKQWLIDQGYKEKWMLTKTYDRDRKTIKDLDKGEYLSLALEAWEDKFPFKHSYPTDNFGAQMVRYLIVKQNLSGFKSTPDKGKKNFWDYVGSDQRVRPYMGIYIAQSSRSQPAATGFMFLKPSWMRSMVLPKKGKAMSMIDYGSEEFFIAALLSRDEKMLQAYFSGDVYFFFAKAANAVPQDAIRKDYEKERDRFKATTLAISYLMTKYGLATKLTQDIGEVHTTDQAQELIDLFYDIFDTFSEWQKQDYEEYFTEQNHIKLLDGYYVFNGSTEDNFRSIINSRVQGAGAAIMRKADLLCYEKGIYIPFTLHDALFVEFDSDDLSAIDKMRDAMREAFVHYFPDDLKEYASKIKMDITVWSDDYEEGKEIYTPAGHKIKLQKKYLDKRSIEYYHKYKKYLEYDVSDI